MNQLSPKQTRIYEFILSFTEQNGYPPSVREIADAVGLKSPSTVHFHLKSLEEAGVITRGAGKTRAITAVHRVELPPQLPENRVPLLGDVAAGAPILAQECVEEYVPFDTNGEDCFALRIRGESMLKAGILPGDLVIVRRQETAVNGEIVTWRSLLVKILAQVDILVLNYIFSKLVIFKKKETAEKETAE